MGHTNTGVFYPQHQSRSERPDHASLPKGSVQRCQRWQPACIDVTRVKPRARVVLASVTLQTLDAPVFELVQNCLAQIGAGQTWISMQQSLL